MENIINLFKEKNIEKVYINEPMKNHTTFKVGGPADILVVVSNEQEILDSIRICRENDIDYLIVGNGSNLLVRDEGIRGIVIKINEDYSNIIIDEDRMYCESGALLTGASRKAMHNNLTGFEFANGIPGTLGGAVTMNAGAYGGEMKDVVSSVRAIDINNNIVEYTNEEMNFRYRSSKVQDDNLIVLGVWIQLKEGNPEEIKEKMRELAFKRTSKQPLEMPSAGSTFKRPEGYFAAKLIEDAGLKGMIHKGAQVSEKHSGFVINKDNATCRDILELIEIIKQTVKEKFDVELEREVKIVGEEK